MKPVRTFITRTIVFITAALAMAGLLVLVAMIPKDAIQEKCLESAQYLADNELFGDTLEGIAGSRIDRYADSILLNIAYNYDRLHPLKSVILSAYHFDKYQEENINFLNAVTEDLPANQQYLRYWHGSITIIRPLLTLFSIRQIYILNGIILLFLTAVFLIMTIKQRLYAPAIGMITALISTGCWFVPLSLEYMWTFKVMLIASIVALRISDSSKEKNYAVFFLLTGMITNWLDFLTTETVTLLIPLLIILWTKRTLSYDKDPAYGETWYSPVKICIESGIAWLVGYIGMWLSKWILSAIVLRENVIPYISEHISERLGGDVGISLSGYLTGAITRNIGCLFPFGYGSAGFIIGLILPFAAAYLGFVYRRMDFNLKYVLLYAIVGIIPYVRYLILHNHSYIHFFFTYRAQAATVMAVVFMLSELTGIGSCTVKKGRCN